MKKNTQSTISCAKTCRCSQNSNYNPEAQAANAIVVAENVDGLRVENLSARMPAAGGAVPEMRDFWMRGVRHATLDCPQLSPNRDGVAAAFADCSDIVRRA